MPTPPLAYKTVTGQYVAPDGSVVAGTLRFIPSATVYDSAGNVVVPPLPIEVVLDGTGSFSVALEVTDDATTSPVGWAWQMSELMPNGQETTFQVPSSSPSTVGLGMLTPATTSLPQYSYMTTAQGAALDARVTHIEDVATIITTATVDAPANVGSLRTLGTGALQAAPGTVDAAAGVGSVRTLGTGALQAAAGNHTHTADVIVGYGGDNFILTLGGAL